LQRARSLPERLLESRGDNRRATAAELYRAVRRSAYLINGTRSVLQLAQWIVARTSHQFSQCIVMTTDVRSMHRLGAHHL